MGAPWHAAALRWLQQLNAKQAGAAAGSFNVGYKISYENGRTAGRPALEGQRVAPAAPGTPGAPHCAAGLGLQSHT